MLCQRTIIDDGHFKLERLLRSQYQWEVVTVFRFLNFIIRFLNYNLSSFMHDIESQTPPSLRLPAPSHVCAKISLLRRCVARLLTEAQLGFVRGRSSHQYEHLQGQGGMNRG